MPESKIGREWNGYKAATYPSGIPTVEQHDQLQMAFYGGMVSLKRLLFDATEGSEESSVENVKAINKEMQDWLDNFKKRNAT